MAKADLQLWLSFLEQYNGKSIFIDDKFIINNTICLHTDSAKSLGYGAVYGSHWFFGSSPIEWTTFSITFLELYPIVVAVHVWARFWKNQSIVIFTDNLALVAIIDQHIMKLLRILILSCMQNNILFQGKHIIGSKNTLADCLSRLQVKKFQQLSPTSRPHPGQLPIHLLPENFLRKSTIC